jgi:hypothetical protein
MEHQTCAAEQRLLGLAGAERRALPEPGPDWRVLRQVLAPAADQVVHHAHCEAACEQQVDHVAAMNPAPPVTTAIGLAFMPP